MKQLLNSNEIFSMGLHEIGLFIDGPIKIYILRVPGGWIYSVPERGEFPTFGVFVPFNNEFQTFI